MNVEPAATTKRSLSAGACSFLFHLFLFLLLATFIQPQRPALRIDPERAVQIVLRSDPSATYQVQDSTDSVRQNERQNEPHPQSRSPASSGREQPVSVPDLEQMSRSIPPELALPVNDTVAAAGKSLSAQRFTAGSAGRSTRIPLPGDVGSFIADEQARLRAGRPTGEAARMSLFGGPAVEARSFVFLIDRSKSMGSEGLGALQAAEEELLVALRPLQSHHQFQVIAYHHQCVFLDRRQLLPATEPNKGAVRGFLSGLAPFGATEHEMALQTALIHAPDVLYLLTDGGDPELSEVQIRKISKLAGARTSIHCIHFGFGQLSTPDHFLKRLAAQNRGGYQYIDMSGRR
jgi:hypothetical protein